MWSEWHDQIKSVNEDVRAEIILAELMASNSIAENDFFFSLNGGFHRMVSDDIAAIQAPGTAKHKSKRGFIELNRRGLYDGLPEGIFHQNRQSKPFRSMTEVKEQIAHQNTVERHARRFFSPLDHELVMCRCAIELNERSMTSDLLATAKHSGLKGFWQIPDIYDNTEQGRLMVLMPLASTLSASLDSAGKAMETVLDIPVNISRCKGKTTSEISFSPVLLGAGLLGIDTVTSGAVQSQGTDVLLSVGPLSPKEAARFGPSTRGRKKLMHLCEQFISADLEVHIEVEVLAAQQQMQFSENGEGARLGVTTYLN